jgi:arsenate reductase (thioredoxin)
VLDQLTRQRIGDTTDRLVAEYDGVFARATVERVVEDSVERLGHVSVTTYVPVLVERFARDRLRAAAQAEGLLAKSHPVVLFVCAHNSGRSQMAAALARRVSEGRIESRSAGSDPASTIEPTVIAALAEVGIDVDLEFPKPLTDEVVRSADVVVTMGCGEACPVIDGPRYIDWPIADPAGRDLAAVRAIRQDVSDHVLNLLEELL